MMHSAPNLYRAPRPALRGLGADAATYRPLIASGAQLSSAIQSGSGQAVTMASLGTAGAALSAASSSGAFAAGTTMAAAVPIIGAAIAGVMIALTLIFNRKGPKQKVATTEIVNKVEPELKKNLAGYMALPIHYQSAQTAALANFDAGWQYVVQSCNIPEMGEPGVRCTADRQPGGKWDWFSYYRDPIANDPNVVPDPQRDAVTGDVIGDNGGTTIAGMTFSNNTLLMAGGGFLLLALMSGGSSR